MALDDPGGDGAAQAAVARAGGFAGAFMQQFGPVLRWPRSKLNDMPRLDAALIARIVQQPGAQNEGRSVAQLEQIRDANLIAMMRALKGQGWGAGTCSASSMSG